MRKSVLVVSLVLVGCTTAEQSPPPVVKATTPRALTSAEKAVVEEGVRKSLKDPNSAMFGPMAAAQEDEKNTWVCGYVNARNSYGGYTGDKPFMGGLAHIPAEKQKIETFVVTGIGGTESASYEVLEMCRRYGVLPR